MLQKPLYFYQSKFVDIISYSCKITINVISRQNVKQSNVESEGERGNQRGDLEQFQQSYSLSHYCNRKFKL